MAQKKILGNQINLADLGPQLDQYSTTDLVTDLSPVLGADLDVGGFDIVGGNLREINITGGINTADYGTGGAVSLTGGNGSGADSYSGAIALQGGNNTATVTGTGGGGPISLYGGSATSGFGGSIVIISGGSTGVNYPGDLRMAGGDAYTGSTATRAGIAKLSGGSSNVTAVPAGNVNFVGGRNTQVGTGGDITLTPGGGTTVGNIELHYGEVAVGQASVEFWDDTNAAHTTGNFVALKAPTFVGSTDITFTLPELDGATGDVMLTDGSGNLSFGPWVLPKYTVGTLPLVVEGGQIYVTDATAASAGVGAQCFGRGVGSPLLTEWVDVTTGLAVV